jgi:long-chain acyl-CoA synthetase
MLLQGTPVVVLGHFDAEKTLSAIQTYRVATTLMVPTHFARLLSLPRSVRQQYDLSSLVLVAHTGSRCPIPTKRAMIDWVGPILRESYGATEGGLVSWISSEEWLRHPGSVGRAVAGCEVFVLDGSGEPVPTGAEGQLCFSVPGREIRYEGDSGIAKEAYLKPGIFTFGEVGYVNSDGYIFITDRSTDMVVSGGVNIYPAEYERVLLERDDIYDATVFGIPDPEMGERLVGLVVTNDPTITAEELIAYGRARLAHYKVPRTVELTEAIPRTLMGKVNKRDLRDWYLGRRELGG